jgi:selenocysteine-specific elongation factor
MTVIATAGHVDHGKSSLVLALTGTEPDRLEEEKRRGLTIDLGFAHSTLPSGAAVSFIDVPGHVRFLRNMLAGVGGVSACLFVVDASEGWKPQSEEHLRILHLLGIEHGVIALTKTDLVDDDLLALAELEVTERVEGSFLEAAPIVAVSTVTGRGLDMLGAALDDVVSTSRAALDRGRPRLWVDRVFAAAGSGTVVTGTLADGAVHLDQRMVVQPGGAEVRVRSIQRAGHAVDAIGPGERVALNLAGIDHRSIERGNAVIEPDRWRLTRRVDASLTVLAALDHDVSRRGAYLAYIGSGEYPVTMRVLGHERLVPGATGAVRLFLPDGLPLLPGDRYVLRESGRDETIGGGEILDIDPVLKASIAAPDRTIDRLVREREWIRVADVEALTGEHVVPTIGDWLSTPTAIEQMEHSLRARLDDGGALGVDVARLDDRERAVLATMDGITVDRGRARLDGADTLLGHPGLERLGEGGFAPAPPDDIDRATLSELVRLGHVVVRDGIYFHRETVDRAGYVAAELLGAHADGFTVGEFRDATGASRRFAIPLLAELDARGVTRRRGDLRVAGPRLVPTAGE